VGSDLTIAINVSPVQSRQPRCAARLSHIITDSGANPAALEIGVTESAVMESMGEAVSILNKMKAIGVKIALDDFGTGYSSLSSLSSLPIDKLKVDRAFVQRIERDPTSRTVIDAIIALGRSLQLAVVGEGIESEGVLRHLQGQGCTHAQGFWFSRPLPPAELASWYHEMKKKENAPAAE